MNKTSRTLSKQKTVIEEAIEVTKVKCRDLQRLKFGKEIDLDSLDKMANSENVKAIEEKITMCRSENNRSINVLKQQVLQAQEELLELTKMNTRLLESIASLTAEQVSYATANC